MSMSTRETAAGLTGEASPLKVIATVLVLSAGLAGLYLGQAVLIPLGLAILLSFVLLPLAFRLRRWRFGRSGSVATVLVAAVLAVGMLGWVLSGQLIQLAASLPTYESNLRQKVQDLDSAMHGEGIWTRLSHLANRLGTTIEPADGPTPMLVRVEATGLDQLGTTLAAFQTIAHSLVTPGLVLLFLAFIMMQHEDLRDRLIRLAGPNDINRTTRMMNDAAQRLARYFTAQLLVNAIFGATFGLALFVIGVPNAALWGTLGTILRFIPYVGAPLSALFPLTLSLAVDPGWAMLLQVGGAFLLIELVVAHFIEPLLYGAKTGLSPLALLVASAFWSLVWGPIGLVMAPPLLVCLVVLGRHIPQLSVLDVLFGNRPALTPAMSIYQRLLAGDHQRALELAEALEDKESLVAMHERALVPALAQAEEDRRRDDLTPAAYLQVLQQMNLLLAELDEHERGLPNAPLLACKGGRGAADEVGARMLSQVLREAGYLATTAMEAGDRPAVLFLVVVAPLSDQQLRRRLRRLGQIASRPTVLVRLNGGERTSTISDLAGTVNSVGEALALANELAPLPAAEPQTDRQNDMLVTLTITSSAPASSAVPI